MAYEYRDRVPGLNYTVNGREEWTPVKKARRKRIKKPVSSTNDAITSVVRVVQVWMSLAADWWSTVYKKVFLVSPSIAKIHTGHLLYPALFQVELGVKRRKPDCYCCYLMLVTVVF